MLQLSLKSSQPALKTKTKKTFKINNKDKKTTSVGNIENFLLAFP